MKTKIKKPLILSYILMSLVIISGCGSGQSKDTINKSLSIKEVIVYKYNYTITGAEFKYEPIDQEGNVLITLNSVIPEDMKVDGTVLNEKGEEIYTGRVWADATGMVSMLLKSDPSRLQMFVNGNYKVLLSYNDSKTNEKVSLNSIPFTITDGFKDLKEAKSKYDEYLVKKGVKEKEESDKEAKEINERQEMDKAISDNIEKTRFTKLSNDGYTEVWEIYVEKGRDLRISGKAGSKLGIAIRNEAGDLVESKLLNAGTYNEFFTLNSDYNGYYTVELDYIKSYKYNWSFNVQ